MHDIFLVYPHQLFQDITPLKGKKVLLIEEPLFFTLYTFHIQKLVLHRASIKFYESYLHQQGIDVSYYEDESYLEIYSTHQVFIYDVVDAWLSQKIADNFSQLTVLVNPNFLNVEDENRFFYHYYINRRKALGILIDKGKPLGGKWSFDSANRQKIPKDLPIPSELCFENDYIDEAKNYCKKFDSLGECEIFYYPITYEEAKINLDYFLKYKFQDFGAYQDAIHQESHFLFHSNISSSLNIGLINLQELISSILTQNIALNSKEGLIRQIIGWREYMLSIYKTSHIPLRQSNFFGFHHQLSPKLLTATTGLTPLDDVMKKLYKTGYSHHIERLMILGNLFLLLEIHPDEIHKFFMAHYIDAYDWVMVGNVYGMSGYSDGGSMVTKPYVSSSNYILKMSRDYKKSDAWCAIWDGLYWRFLDKYQNLLKENPRMKMQFALLKKMDKNLLKEHIARAEKFMTSLGF